MVAFAQISHRPTKPPHPGFSIGLPMRPSQAYGVQCWRIVSSFDVLKGDATGVSNLFAYILMPYANGWEEKWPGKREREASRCLALRGASVSKWYVKMVGFGLYLAFQARRFSLLS